MADVKLKCPKCGNEVAVSQFAKTDDLVCKCGEKLSQTAPTPESVPKPKHAALTFKTNEQVEAEISKKPDLTSKRDVSKLTPNRLVLKTEEQIATEHAAPEGPEEWKFSQATAKTEEQQQQPKNIHLYLSWLVFIVLAGTAGYFRYKPDALSPANLALLKTYSPLLFGVLYVTIILKAFKDNVYQGLLCLLPGYPLYYIVMNCDDFYMRAVIAGLMVGIGQDSILFFNVEAERGIKRVQDLIAGGA